MNINREDFLKRWALIHELHFQKKTLFTKFPKYQGHARDPKALSLSLSLSMLLLLLLVVVSWKQKSAPLVSVGSPAGARVSRAFSAPNARRERCWVLQAEHRRFEWETLSLRRVDQGDLLGLARGPRSEISGEGAACCCRRLSRAASSGSGTGACAVAQGESG